MTNLDREFVIHQYCLDKKAIVRRDSECLHVCNNPKCKSCEPWREAFNQLSDEFIKLKNDEEFQQYLTKAEKKILDKSKISINSKKKKV